MEEEKKCSRSRMTAVRGQQVQSVIRKLKRSQELLGITLGRLAVVDLSQGAAPPPGPDDAAKPTQGKHIAQHASLLAHMRRLELFNEETSSCFVEFGSGVGRLSEQLQEETDCRHSHLMIDREHFKNTRLRDRSMQKKISANGDSGSSARPWVSRVTDDIKNISLRESLMAEKTDASATADFCQPVVAVSKHLCGKGFDIALSRIAEYNNSDLNSPVDTVPICMAPCCHSICEWDECFYQSFFTALGFASTDYSVLSAASQWASIQDCTVGVRDIVTATRSTDVMSAPANTELILKGNMLELFESIAVNNEDEEYGTHRGSLFSDNEDEEERMLNLESDDFEAKLTKSMKRKIGVVCKEFIDIGRSIGLLIAGYSEVRLVRYTRSSKENMLICAK